MSDPLEIIWDGILSRNAEEIRKAFSSLGVDQQRDILLHLKKMTEETDWHYEQRKSALVALKVINPDFSKEKRKTHKPKHR